jgi:Sel1 repeat-containing protein
MDRLSHSGIEPRTARPGRRALLAIVVAVVLPHWAAAADVGGLRQAATRGDPEALFELGSRYEQADGVEHDIERAAQYLRLAAERGHHEAQYRLGLLYAGGLGLPRDREQSYEWLRVAAAGEGRTALLAAALGEAVAADLPAAAVAHAQQLAMQFQPVSFPPKLPAEDAAPTGMASAPDQMAELTPLLARARCGEPALTRDQQGRIIAAGYRPDRGSAAPADNDVEKLLEQRGVTAELTPLAPALCRVLDLIATAAGKDQPAPEVVLRDPKGLPKEVFRDQDYLVIELPPLPEEHFAAVDYFVHDGSVVHMLPSLAYPRNRLSAGEGLRLGQPGAGGQVWQISPPFGRDLLVVFTSGRPLYQDKRPGVEPIDGYLDFLRGRLAAAAPEDPIRIGYRVIQTESR